MVSVEIFCCYARKDQLFLKRLISYLAPLKQRELITLWADVDIEAGTEWESEIRQHLNKAHIILLLISHDFMASKYCYSIEMTQAMERHNQGEARVIPILLHPCLWQEAPFARLQILPANCKAISSWKDSRQAYNNVALGISKIVEEILIQQPLKEKKAELLPTRSNPEPPSQLNLEATNLEKESEVRSSANAEEDQTEQRNHRYDTVPDLQVTEEMLKPAPEEILFQQSEQLPSTSTDIPSEVDGTAETPENLEEEREQQKEGGRELDTPALMNPIPEQPEPQPDSPAPPPSPVVAHHLRPSSNTQPSHSKGKVKAAVLIVTLVLAMLIGSAGLLHSIMTASSKDNFRHPATATATNIVPKPTYLSIPANANLALDDPLIDNSKGNRWEENSKSNGSCSFDGESYNVNFNSSAQFSSYSCRGLGTDFKNFIFEVQMNFTIDTNGSGGGVLFRVDSKSGKGYFFEIDRGGNFNLFADGRILTSGSGLATSLTNQVAVVADGTTITLYVNNQQIARVTDNTYSHGEIGFVTTSIPEFEGYPYSYEGYPYSTVVFFSNAKVWTL